jgi:hypothetical protein
MLSRRKFCIAGAAFAPAIAFADDGSLGSRCVAAILAALDAMPSGPVLLNSYMVQTGAGAGDFDLTQADAAYVYDNALAGLALLAAGHRAQAQRIGDALALAQAQDRFWHDGRLRNAYQAGPMTNPAKLPGWWDAKAARWNEDPYQVGSQTGPVAWAMLLWAALGQTAPAIRAAAWLNKFLPAPSGYYGGFYGFEPNPLKLTWQSTEQNVDLYAAFSKLGRADDAAHAKKFVAAMFDVNFQRFDAGLSPAGAVNHLTAADAGVWPYLAGLGSAASASIAIKELTRGAGIGFSDASESIWLEGTAFAALALRLQNDPRAASFMATIGGNLSPGGYVYATVAPELSTGLTVGPSLTPAQPALPFNYFRRPSLSATAWTAIAAQGSSLDFFH